MRQGSAANTGDVSKGTGSVQQFKCMAQKGLDQQGRRRLVGQAQ